MRSVTSTVNIVEFPENVSGERKQRRCAPRSATGGISITRTELSAEPERRSVAVGLKRSDVTGKSCARRMVMIDWSGVSEGLAGGRPHMQGRRIENADAQIGRAVGEESSVVATVPREPRLV